MTPAQRHDCMSRIRSKDTGPEWAVRRAVFAMGFRYRLYDKRLPGKPDLVLPRHRKVIFVHGCFWHAHGCRIGGHTPATHKKFWKTKFANNVRRDREALRRLWRAGWRTLVVWECETRDPERLRSVLTAFLQPAVRAPDYGLEARHALYGMVAEPQVDGRPGYRPARPAARAGSTAVEPFRQRTKRQR